MNTLINFTLAYTMRMGITSKAIVLLIIWGGSIYGL